MKIRLIFFLLMASNLIIYFPLFAQVEKPERVQRIVYEVRSDDWYAQQAQLWKKEIDKNPHDANAWLNYYFALRYRKFKDFGENQQKERLLSQTIEQMKSQVPNSWQYNYLVYKNSGNNPDKFAFLEQAYKINPDEPELYYEFIAYYLIAGNRDRVEEYLGKLYQSRDVADELLNYNYNMLVSVEKNGILFTNGDNDTYPALVLQERGIRDDVLVLNVHLCLAGKYLETQLKKIGVSIDKRKLINQAKAQSKKSNKSFPMKEYLKLLIDAILHEKPEQSIFISATVYPGYIEEVKDNLYIEGIVYRYSEERIDNIAFIKKNFEKKYRLDYLEKEWYHEPQGIQTVMALLNNNYIPAMILLARHYKNSGEEFKVQSLKDMIYKIGYASGRAEAIQNYFDSQIEK